MRKLLEIIAALAIIIFLFWCMFHTSEEKMYVSKSEHIGNYYVIYVVNEYGNEFSYYSGDSLPYGTAVTCVFHGNEIVDVVKGEY